MKTLKNVAQTLLNLAWGAYIATLTLGGLWLLYQPEPWMPEAPGFAMIIGDSDYEVGDGYMFCAYGAAWEETLFLGINIPVLEDGKLVHCHYDKNVADWSFKMGPVSKYTEL